MSYPLSHTVVNKNKKKNNRNMLEMVSGSLTDWQIPAETGWGTPIEMSSIFLLCSELSYIPPTEITLPCVFEVVWASLSGIWLGPGIVAPKDETTPLCIIEIQWIASALLCSLGTSCLKVFLSLPPVQLTGVWRGSDVDVDACMALVCALSITWEARLIFVLIPEVIHFRGVQIYSLTNVKSPLVVQHSTFSLDFSPSLPSRIWWFSSCM